MSDQITSLVSAITKFLGCPCTYFAPMVDDEPLMEAYRQALEESAELKTFVPVIIVPSETLLDTLVMNSDETANGDDIPEKYDLDEVTRFRNELLTADSTQGGAALSELVSIAQDVLEDPDKMDKLINRQAELQDKLDAADAWNIDNKLERAMDALRCPPENQNVATLSGGERRRVALCRLLLQNPDILLLDEPTNHLDAESIDWLEQHLQQYKGTVIAITHDRYFLDHVAGWILELDRGEGIPWKGNYSSWLEQKTKRMEQEEKQASKRRKTLERELEWIRMAPKARHAKGKARPPSQRRPKRTGRKIGNLHPERTAFGQQGDRSATCGKGLWRQSAVRRSQFHAPAKRHCRRNRTERCRKDHTVQAHHGS